MMRHQLKLFLQSATLAVLALAILATIPAQAADDPVGTIDEHKIKTNYVPKGELTEQQTKIVVELAKQRGIEKVAEIRTYYLRPTEMIGITVLGVEQTDGNEVSYQSLSVTNKHWWRKNDEPKEDDIQLGDFWAGKPFTSTRTILTVGDKEYRIGTPVDLSSQECETILAQLLAGKFKMAEGAKNQQFLGFVDWSRPTGFRKKDEVIEAGFDLKDRDGFSTVKMKETNEGILISEIQMAVP